MAPTREDLVPNPIAIISLPTDYALFKAAIYNLFCYIPYFSSLMCFQMLLKFLTQTRILHDVSNVVAVDVAVVVVVKMTGH